MPRLLELREQQARIVSEARERLEGVTASTDDARAAELRSQHDAAMAEFDRIQGEIEQLEAVEARARQLGDIDTSRRPNRDERNSRSDEGDGVQNNDRTVFQRAIQFGPEALTEPERRSFNRFIVSAMAPEQRAQSVGTASAGGYLVPQGFLPEIIKSLAAWGPMTDESLVRVMRTDTGNSIPIPTVNDTSNTGEDHTENTAASDQDVTIGQKQLDAYIIDSGTVKVSFELLQDSAFDFGQLLDDLFGERLGRRANSKLTVGTGSSQANGIVTASTLGKTAASASAIAADELIDLLHSVDPAYREAPKCAWQFHDTTLQAVRKLKDGQGNYLWQMGDVRVGAPPTLLGKPYRINQAMAQIATGNKVAIFGDHGKYITRIVRNFQMLRLNERYAEALQVGFLAYMRFDGELTDTAAVKHYKMA